LKVLVTGAAGFIGAALSKTLAQRGDEVLGLDNLNDYYDVSLKKARLKELEGFDDFQFEKIDLADREVLSQIYKKFEPEVVVNLAAQAGVRYSIDNPFAYVNSNLVGFVNLLECCRNFGCRHLVFASSSSVYGANTKMPYSVHDGADHPISLYAATKKSNEMIAHSYSHLYKIPTTGLRFFTVYGPWGRPDMAVFKFTKMILAGETIEIYNNGQHHRDFTFIDDIIEGVVRVMDRPAVENPLWTGERPDPATSRAPYKLYNIGNHSPVLLMDFVKTLEEALGKEANKVFKEMQMGDVPDTYADCEDLKLDFEFQPQTSLKKGLESFVAWYRSFY
jgi:UDP-glucuronate 4-epimerase